MSTSSTVLLLLVLAVWLLPLVIAGYREHPNGAAIAALDLLLGWTFLGWVAALVWSLTAIPKPDAGGQVSEVRDRIPGPSASPGSADVDMPVTTPEQARRLGQDHLRTEREARWREQPSSDP